jgi:type I restriction enzyme S subunit
MATSQDFVNWVCGPELDPWFLANALIASRDYLRQLASGAIHKTIYVPEVKSFQVCLPASVPEQRRIVANLAKLRATVVNTQFAISVEARELLATPKTVTSSWLAALRERYGEQELIEFSEGDDCFRDGPFGSNLKSSHYEQQGARVIRLQNIGDGKFLDADHVYISMDHYDSISRHNVRGGDVVVASLGDGARAAGRACLVPELTSPAVVKADCFRVRLPATKIEPNYLVSCLNSVDGQAQFNAQIRGATRQRINLSMLRKIRIPNAPLAAQRTFAEKAAALGTATEVAQDAFAEVERETATLGPALLRAAFSGAL